MKVRWLLLLASTVAMAVSGIQILQPRAFATAAGAPTALILLSVHNTGASADTLLGASTPLAARVDMHAMSMTAGVMSMRPVARVAVPVGALVEFSSGGSHLMLVGLQRPLEPGMVVPLTLKFERAGEIKVNVPVLPMTAVR